MALPFAACAATPRSFWQARFYDFNVYKEGKKNEKLNYMHANPVKRGLVEHPRDWPWSSWEFYWGQEKPLISIDVGREKKPKTQVPKTGTRGTLRLSILLRAVRQ